MVQSSIEASVVRQDFKAGAWTRHNIVRFLDDPGSIKLVLALASYSVGANFPIGCWGIQNRRLIRTEPEPILRKQGRDLRVQHAPEAGEKFRGER